MRRAQFLSFVLFFYNGKHKKEISAKRHCSQRAVIVFTSEGVGIWVFTMRKQSLAKMFLSSDKVKQKGWKQ